MNFWFEILGFNKMLCFISCVNNTNFLRFTTSNTIFIFKLCIV